MLIQVYLVMSTVILGAFTATNLAGTQNESWEIFVKALLLLLTIFGAVAAYSSF